MTDDARAGRRTFRLLRVPPFLLLHVRRFQRNQFVLEKDPTIVNFPMKGMRLGEVVPVTQGAGRYDLITSISHEGPVRVQVDKTEKGGVVGGGSTGMPGTWSVFVQRRVEDLWYEVQDLNVTEVLPQVVALSEAYLQCYEVAGGFDDPSTVT